MVHGMLTEKECDSSSQTVGGKGDGETAVARL